MSALDDEMPLHIMIAPPLELSPALLDQVEGLIRRGGEVATGGLAARIRSAEAVGYAAREGEMVAVGALKRPQSGYRSKAFKSAEVPLEGWSDALELGWLFVQPHFRDRGLGSRIARELVEYSSGPLYATVRSANVRMIHILEQMGFRRGGNCYQGEQSGESVALLLYG